MSDFLHMYLHMYLKKCLSSFLYFPSILLFYLSESILFIFSLLYPFPTFLSLLTSTFFQIVFNLILHKFPKTDLTLKMLQILVNLTFTTSNVNILGNFRFSKWSILDICTYKIQKKNWFAIFYLFLFSL
jgi:hypothetical protein